MDSKRRIGTGVYRIIRFNWHFYAIAFGIFFLLFICVGQTEGVLNLVLWLFLINGLLSVMVSLLVSFYVYDLSGLYDMHWLQHIGISRPKRILNIHAGFDESSLMLREKFPEANLLVCDFYDPLKHTELSIRRARKLYPALPGTIPISTDQLPMASQTADLILLMFSAHEIRDQRERRHFLAECARVLEPDGRIVIVEHLRDLNNFLAYNIGFFHFHSRQIWMYDLKAAELKMQESFRLNPFVSMFILSTHGNSH